MPEPDAAAPGGRLKPTADRGPTISDNPAAVPERRRPHPPHPPHPPHSPLDSPVRAIGEVTAFRRTDEETVPEMAEALRAHLDLPGLLTEDQRESDPARYRQHVLHARSDGSFSIVALVWLPGQETQMHDHVAWCVTGVYEGRATEQRFTLAEGSLSGGGAPPAAALTPGEETVHHAGEVSGLPCRATSTACATRATGRRSFCTSTAPT
ncbi:cysteine dioxygenase [Streptomyces sp. S1A(2023)]